MAKHRLLTKAWAAWMIFFALLRISASGQTPGYDQPYRPQVHFSPRQNWTNDPNGLIYLDGEYHLFYQYNPFGQEWGHMSWGHAVSTDLLHWHELPVAIPEHDGVMIFTGSIIVDRENTSGLCKPKTSCMVAIYTGSSTGAHGPLQDQNLAYSLDNGRTWTEYEGNPVLDLHMADFRDPSVTWNEQDHAWIMVVSLPKQHKVRLYRSPDLKRWTQISEFGPAGDTAGDWECPDLLQIPAADPNSPGMWALKVGLNPGAPQGGSGEQYFLGSFDGAHFTASTLPGAHGWTNYGKDDYCAISFNGLPKQQEPVLIGWMSNWQYAAALPTAPWRGQMSLPRRLSLIRDSAGIALAQDPVVAPLRGEAKQVFATLRPGGLPVALLTQQAPFELDVRFESAPKAHFGLRIYGDKQHWTDIAFDRQSGQFYMDRTHSGKNPGPGFSARTTAPIANGRIYTLRLIVDRSSMEAYAQDGTIAMTDLIFPPSVTSRVEIFSSGSGTLRITGTMWHLQSVWK